MQETFGQAASRLASTLAIQGRLGILPSGIRWTREGRADLPVCSITLNHQTGMSGAGVWHKSSRTPSRLMRMAYRFFAPFPCRNGVVPRFAAAAQPTSHQYQAPRPSAQPPRQHGRRTRPCLQESHGTPLPSKRSVHPGPRQPQRQKRHARLGVSDGNIKTCAKLQGRSGDAPATIVR